MQLSVKVTLVLRTPAGTPRHGRRHGPYAVRNALELLILLLDGRVAAQAAVRRELPAGWRLDYLLVQRVSGGVDVGWFGFGPDCPDPDALAGARWAEEEQRQAEDFKAAVHVVRTVQGILETWA